jgi:hypothetical protein
MRRNAMIARIRPRPLPAPGGSSVSGVSDPDLITSLQAAEQRLQAAQLASDVAVLDRLLDDGLLFTGPDGSLLSKEDDLNAHRSGWQKVRQLDQLDLRVRVVGSTGVSGC